MNGDSVTYFDSFRFEYVLKETKKLIGNRNIRRNIYRIQANDLIIFGYFWIGSIDFMLKGRIWLDYINLLSPKENETNDKIKLEYF